MYNLTASGKVETYVTKSGKSSKVMSFKCIFCFFALGLLICTLSWLAFVRNVTTHMQLMSEPIYISINEAQLSEKWSHEDELDVQDEGKFHVVTNLILVTHKHYSINLRYENNRIPDANQLQDRQTEIESTLQLNLNNDKIAAVHVLYFHPAVAQYLLKLPLQNSKKLILHLTKRDPTVGINLDYIQSYLKHKPVILMHMDNFLGSGWEDVDFTLLRTQRLVYALTRHSVTSKFPCNAAVSASCNPGTAYMGSHDAFVFHADRDFEKEMLQELDTGPNSNGIENVLIWYLREKMGYRVINPCLHLIVYHNHCVPIRDIGRKRFNRKGKNGLAQFTRELT
ncbi:uncharacterized protein LOC105844041 isoform X1 [Hydra vulgaris]|nr:uncharacterized protein LOC105844041 [Hydra vulgaris]